MLVELSTHCSLDDNRTTSYPPLPSIKDRINFVYTVLGKSLGKTCQSPNGENTVLPLDLIISRT